MAEIDGDDASAFCIRRRKRLQRAVDPLCGRRRKIEIAVDAIDHAFAAERSQTMPSEVLASLEPDSVDSVVTDPPYHLARTRQPRKRFERLH
jgi:hypothetical protein